MSITNAYNRVHSRSHRILTVGGRLVRCEGLAKYHGDQVLRHVRRLPIDKHVLRRLDIVDIAHRKHVIYAHNAQLVVDLDETLLVVKFGWKKVRVGHNAICWDDKVADKGLAAGEVELPLAARQSNGLADLDVEPDLDANLGEQLECRVGHTGWLTSENSRAVGDLTNIR